MPTYMHGVQMHVQAPRVRLAPARVSSATMHVKIQRAQSATFLAPATRRVTKKRTISATVRAMPILRAFMHLKQSIAVRATAL